MTKDQILAALPKLGQNDLKAIKAVIEAILNGPQMATGALNEFEGRCYEALRDCLTSRGLIAPPFASINSTTYGKAFRDNSIDFITYLNLNFPTVLKNRVSSVAMMRFALDLLADDLTKKEIPVTVGSMAVNMLRIGQVLRAAFPGYFEAGMQHLIARRMTHE